MMLATSQSRYFWTFGVNWPKYRLMKKYLDPRVTPKPNYIDDLSLLVNSSVHEIFYGLSENQHKLLKELNSSLLTLISATNSSNQINRELYKKIIAFDVRKYPTADRDSPNLDNETTNTLLSRLVGAIDSHEHIQIKPDEIKSNAVNPTPTDLIFSKLGLIANFALVVLLAVLVVKLHFRDRPSYRIRKSETSEAQLELV